MSATVKELREWLAEMPETDLIGVDEGGLTLVQFGPDAGPEELRNAWSDPATATSYFEIGGVPEPDEDEAPHG